MDLRRDDHVRIPLGRGTFLLPRTSCEALLKVFPQLSPMDDVRKAFDDAGTSMFVHLTQTQKRALIEVIEVWGSQLEGGLTDGLPAGVFELRNAVHDDLCNRPGDRRSV